MSSRKIIIGSRGSDLALWQANHVQSQLKNIGLDSEIKIISTEGDRSQQWNTSFDKLEGKGFFTKEIEEALLKSEIDLAVHSHKDLPTENPEGLIVAAVSEREDPSELILIRKEAVDLKQKYSFKLNAIFGTSSARRKSQLLAFRADAQIQDLRGNVPTRINKLRNGQYEAIMLAAAGVERLNIDLSEFHVEKLSPEEFVPAPAQGVLALQIRESDKELFTHLQKMNCSDVQKSIAVERKVLNLLDGGCLLPLGVYCKTENNISKIYTSKALSWDKAPLRLYHEITDNTGVSEGIAKRINSSVKSSVFITRDIKHDSFFYKSLTDNGVEVHGASLINIKQIDFTSVPKTDWIFFSSKNSVDFFFKQNPTIDAKMKFGCVGSATAEALRKMGYITKYIGNNVDTSITAKDFSALAKEETVLFPMAKQSRQAIQKEIKNAVNLVCYETTSLKIDTIPAAETLVFTSPSNVEAFFTQAQILPQQKVIAIGNSTADTLKTKGVSNIHIPRIPDELGLVECVFGVC